MEYIILNKKFIENQHSFFLNTSEKTVWESRSAQEHGCAYCINNDLDWSEQASGMGETGGCQTQCSTNGDVTDNRVNRQATVSQKTLCYRNPFMLK